MENITFWAPSASNHKIVSVELTEDGTIEVVRQYPSNMMYAVSPPRMAPDTVEKETYAAGPDGKIVMVNTIQGTHEPAYSVAERISFDGINNKGIVWRNK